MKKAFTRSGRTGRPAPSAGDLAASILAFLAADTERFDRFLAVTGLAVADLRGAATTSGFAESLIDYLCTDERLLLAFARESGSDPADIEAVRQSLAPAAFDP